MGILDTAVEYRKNDEENIVGFVQNGELWCYDVAQNKLSLVFGFREGSDLRGSYDEHAIRILKVDESGSMDFLVYGYMNRGTHEGETRRGPVYLRRADQFRGGAGFYREPGVLRGASVQARGNGPT